MRKVVIIPARKNQGNNATKKETKKLRVAAYCRVSTILKTRNQVMKLRFLIIRNI